jgi:hypothetical protein
MEIRKKLRIKDNKMLAKFVFKRLKTGCLLYYLV